MLLKIRDKAQGVFAWIIILFLIIPFALWGIQSYLGGGSETPIAEVEGMEITSGEFNRYYQVFREQQTQRLQAILGGKADLGMFKDLLNEKTMRKQALNTLINNRLILAASLRAGYVVSDVQLRSIIEQEDAFKTDGKFDKQIYEAQLRNQGMTPSMFETRLRADLVADQVYKGIVSTEVPTPHELQQLAKLQNQQRQVGYMKLALADAEQQVQVSDSDIQAYYDKNKKQFWTTEQVSIKYLELSIADVSSNVNPSEDELRTYYENHAADYVVADTSDALNKANSLLKEIRGGASFEELARKYSDDPGSKDAGGDLDYFGRNVMVKEFDDAVFSMNKGDISEPVKTSFGYHIVKLTDIRGDERRASHILITADDSKKRTLSFEEAQQRVKEDYQRQMSEDSFIEKAEMLANLTYETPNSLDEAANALGLEIKTSPLFTRRGGPGIASQKGVAEAAFSDVVLKEAQNSEVIEIGQDHMVVLRVNEHREPVQQSLEDVKEQVTVIVRKDKARAALIEKGEALLAKLNQGSPVESLASEANATWHAPQLAGRGSKEIPADVLGAAFKASKPADGKPAFSGSMLKTGDYAIVGIYEVREGEVGETAKLRAELQQLYGEQSFNDFLENLRQNADISINLENDSS